MYIILEIQTNNNVPATLVHTANTYNEAQSVLMDYHGNTIATEYYTHTESGDENV